MFFLIKQHEDVSNGRKGVMSAQTATIVYCEMHTSLYEPGFFGSEHIKGMRQKTRARGNRGGREILQKFCLPLHFYLESYFHIFQ